MYSPFGSTYFNNLSIIGAINILFTFYSYIILHITPASGGPSILPSNNIVVAPTNNGEYTIIYYPEDQPTSETAN